MLLPFALWGTAMAAMKPLLDGAGPLTLAWLRLLPAGLAANPSASRAIGYREVIAMLAGDLRREELRGEIIANTRALVKKQRTWFRTQLPTHRVVQAAELREVDALFPVSEIPG